MILFCYNLLTSAVRIKITQYFKGKLENIGKKINCYALNSLFHYLSNFNINNVSDVSVAIYCGLF